MNSLTYVVLGMLSLVILALLVLLVTLLTLLLRSQRDTNIATQNLVTNLLISEKTTSQSLLNQLRSQTPSELHGLQSATHVSPEEPYSPEQQQVVSEWADVVDTSQYGDRPNFLGIDDDLRASGWTDPHITGGGSPVVFADGPDER